MVQPTPILKTPKKKWSKWLKFSGSAFLLGAFGIQVLQNTATAINRNNENFLQSEARNRQEALADETLYYSSLAAGKEDRDFLKKAALNLALGDVGFFAARADLQSSDDLKVIQDAADMVHDLDSFNKFSDTRRKLRLANIKRHEDDEPWDFGARFLGRLSLFLTVIGSVLALAGQALD
jgi:hypothetical protein